MKRTGSLFSALRLLPVLIFICLASRTVAASNGLGNSASRRIPVILDTDIGDDIDDTWALGLLLKSHELDLKLVVGDYGRTEYRSKLLAKFLEETKRTDVGVGIGLKTGTEGEGALADWVMGYRLEHYPGRIYQDGVQAMIDTIMRSRQPVTLICIAPMPNLAAALEKEPRIAGRVNLVSMAGSVRLGYGGSKTISEEWNVKADVKAAQRVFAAPWKSMTITPLDTCGVVSLEGEQYRRMLNSPDPIAAEVIENYRIWSRQNKVDAEHQSTTLFDTVAVYLAIHQELCQMENLNVRVTDEGFTVIDPGARSMSVATAWKDLNAYREFLVQRLTGK